MSWYDVSVGPNLAAYNHVRKTAKPEIANQQYAVIAPTLHCAYKRATENTIVGERSMGDARLNYDELTYAWFDHFLKGEKQRHSRKDAQGALLHDGYQQVADIGYVAAARRAADDLVPIQRRQGQHYGRRWRAQLMLRLRLTARQVQLRSNESGAVLWRKCLLHGECRDGRRIRSAQDGGAGRHSGLQHPSRSRKGSK